MNPKLLNLIPKRFFCPYCGKWHNWDKGHKLGYYDSDAYYSQFKCSNVPSGCNSGDYRIYFYDSYCYYSTDSLCARATQSINGKIPISSIIENPNEPIVTFDVPFTAKSDVGNYECEGCKFNGECILVKLGDEGDNRHMTITFGFEFEQSDYNELVQVANLASKEKQLQISQQQQATESKEGSTMTNIFNLKMEFGPNKDENIASTLMGVAVKNGDSWRIYDKKKKEITDVGDMQLGNLPIFILPTTKLNEGDLIKDTGDYYFVTKVATAKAPAQTLSARTGEIKNVVPIKNILGFSCYSQVITLSDSLNMDDNFDLEELAIMSAIYGQTGDNSGQTGDTNVQMNQLLPLLLFKDKLDRDDDKTKHLMLMLSMMNSEDGGQQMNPLLPLLLFKDKLGEDNDKTKNLVLMSSMIGSNTAGSSNPLMNYLMLDALISKKDDESPKTN